MRVLLTLGLTTALLSSPAFAQPFAGSPDEKKEEKPRPKHRSWTVKSGGFAFSFEFTPGIAVPKTLVEAFLAVNEIPKTPHPRFGNQIPQQKARMIMTLIAPDGTTVGRYLVHDIPLSAGQYGLHMTPQVAGIHTMKLEGTTQDGRPLAAELKLPVDVWPLPPELEGKGDAVGGAARGRRRPIVIKKK